MACAHFGAYVMGADINPQLLHGKGIPLTSSLSSYIVM